MSLEQSIIKQKRVKGLIRDILEAVRNGAYVNLHDRPKWSVYPKKGDDPLFISVDYNPFENQAIYKALKEEILH